MKIAVTYENEEVFQHFGKSENFKVYEIVDNMVQSAKVESSNGQGHGALADILAQLNVDVLICGGIGAGAKSALASKQISVVNGVNGNCDAVVDAYLKGTLQYDLNASCSDHHHEHEGHHCASGGCHH
ncbi:MAG: dinitrogenase iron-molybdenum cofactor biosynthesis protein [Erysipelotrichia bacterium]|nr:dinitrogenase iron-molybdenum cofactor biosynthesis protein [Erysipelotrichia bacterium]NCC54131.1 dinitrogenase iron-molybdenum cofactor biosynthesis protein [Erysipelotrichia bacterium]